MFLFINTVVHAILEGKRHSGIPQSSESRFGEESGIKTKLFKQSSWLSNILDIKSRHF